MRNAAGKSQAALAKLCGWSSQSRVGNYESGTREPTLGDIELMAKALGVPYGVLLIGEDFEASRPLVSETSNVGDTHQPTRMYRYPVVSSVTAGAWAEAVEEGFSDRYETSDYKAKGPAFWLEVVGDSMTAPSGTSVPEGMLILVDTGVEPRPGKLVVAKLPSSNDATFKKLIDDAGQLYLKPLNPEYSMIKCTDDCKIIGVAVRVTGFL